MPIKTNDQPRPEMCRFTSWISEGERSGLDEMAREQNTSVNYLVRVAIRNLLGLDTGNTGRALQR